MLYKGRRAMACLSCVESLAEKKTPKTCAYCTHWSNMPVIRDGEVKTMWCSKRILDKNPEILEKGLPCEGFEAK